ncbi:cellulase family glycosylhydrolase [Candidatus Chlorohelix sp.]|uniref:cellulase family glycosylhydrolase n=1 Tax=Candidatus Chlorohelix sp. TaxID=3139201 RepID=UPI00305DB1E0
MTKGIIRVGIVVLTLISLSLLLTTLNPSATPAQATDTNAPVRVSGTRFINGSGQPIFMMGANYVGNTDRAWLMWDDGKFDADMIARNFQTVADAGLNTVRIFVMKPLRDDINANNFSKLDKVFEIAAARKLLILLAFNDYDEPDLAKEAQLNKRIAARYRNNPALFGYDLKNEPQFGDVVPATYPAGTNVPLQRDDFIKAYGERMTQAQVDAWRLTADGKRVVPARLDAKGGYYYANAYKLYTEFLGDSSKWVLSQSGKNTLDYIDSADSNKWRVYLDALSGTLEAWFTTRLQPLREAEPDAPVTVGWSNIVFAKLQANERLNFVSLHRFVSEGYNSVVTTMNLLSNLQRTFPQRPITLEEFGYSNAHTDGSTVPLNVTASQETALWLFLASRGFAGGLKWMLVNFPSGFNAVENNYGLLDDNSQPKPSYQALRAFATFMRGENFLPTLNLSDLKPDGSNIYYLYEGAHALFTNATNRQSGVIRFTQPQASPFSAFWQGADLWLLATQPAPVTLDLDALFPFRDKSGQITITTLGLPDTNLTVSSTSLNLNVEANRLYNIHVPAQLPAFKKATALGNGAWYFPETGHNLKGSFLTYWQNNGGLAMYGYPLSEELTENGFTVQYFQRNRFEYHPENKGTRYEVLLGLLGRDITAGRAPEAAFQSVAAFTSNANSLYFKETGHSLSYGFRLYWERNGGLAQFGFPISEEFSELNPADGKIYTVQYFERARFEYHPELKGTRYETLLGLLGWQVVKERGWL